MTGELEEDNEWECEIPTSRPWRANRGRSSVLLLLDRQFGTQRAQYPLLKACTLNGTGVPNMIKAIFLN